MIDFKAITAHARRYRNPMVKFLREMVAIPSESAGEREVIACIRRKMEEIGVFDRVWVDPFGNLLATLGRGPRLIAIDAHVDTVGVGNPEQWKHDPYRGKVEKGFVYGRGAGDQEGAIPAMVYGAKIIRDLGLVSDDWTLLLTCTTMEEDCDGLCWQYIVNEDELRPECVVVTDSTNCQVLRGQRGRMEIGVTVRGKSCHGSMPHKGDNAVYKIAKVIGEIEKLNRRLRKDKFLGNATITVSYVDCKTPSLCAVPDGAYLHLDRRLTAGDTKASAVREVKAAVKRAGVTAKVEVLRYAKPTYTGLTYATESYFPTWVFQESDPHVAAASETYRALFKRRPRVGRWTFSTNAVSIAGMYGIPSVGFGPAAEATAHTVNDRVPIEHLIKSAAFYAAFPAVYCERYPEPIKTKLKIPNSKNGRRR